MWVGVAPPPALYLGSQFTGHSATFRLAPVLMLAARSFSD